jgi:hypothetical protein
MWYIYTMEYYSAIKNKILSFTAKWMELEIIVLNEKSQTQKDKYHMFSFTCGKLKRSPSECRVVISRGWEGWKEREEGYCYGY